MAKQPALIKIPLNQQNYDTIAEYLRETLIKDVSKYAQIDPWDRAVLVREDTPLDVVFQLGYITGMGVYKTMYQEAKAKIENNVRIKLPSQ